VLRNAAGAVVVVIVLFSSGCMGGDHHDANRDVVPGARVIDVDARSFSFDPDHLQVGAGEDVTIRLHSDDVFHDFVIEGRIGHVVGADGDDTAKGGFRIRTPGTYTFYCSVTGHRSAGMEGTITVR
jgi:cytochrome c oxidase subunit II